MYIKIYFAGKPLFLCNEIDAVIEPYLHHDDSVFIDELNNHTIKSMIYEMELDKVHAGVFLHPQLDELQHEFFKKYHVFVAGGGVVSNSDKDILLMYRRGYWDLPKGKLDDGETIEECALREVHEETGLNDVTLGKKIMTTYHTYKMGSRDYLKQSEWFSMHVEGVPVLTPQVEEDIEKAIWVPQPQVTTYFSKAYPAIVDVLTTYYNML